MNEVGKESKEFVIVTGANGGIGRAIAKHLAEQGLNLVLCTRDKNDPFAIWTSELAEVHNVRIDLMEFDFRNSVDVKTASMSLVKNYKVVGLVNCAGMPFGATILMTKIEDLREVIEVNFINQVLFTQNILKGMCSNKKGSIVNIASMSGINTDAGTLAYGSSKAALIFFTKVAAAESGRYGERVNAVCPGAIDTDMLKQMSEAALEKLKLRSAMARVGTPVEVATTVGFLLSDASSYISGEVIQINGGQG
jgi:3-oxoacyl-[acyl-carrier protein] reductase